MATSEGWKVSGPAPGHEQCRGSPRIAVTPGGTGGLGVLLRQAGQATVSWSESGASRHVLTATPTQTVAELAAAGTEETYEPGAHLFDEGRPAGVIHIHDILRAKII